MNKKEIIAQLIKNGAKETKEVNVSNITITPMDEYTRVTLTTDKELPSMRKDENGVFAESKSNLIFTTPFAISSVMKDIPEAQFAANHIVEHPAAIQVVLSGATIKVITEKIVAGTSYVNPFSTNEDKDPVTFDHDVYVNYVTDIKFSDFGYSKLDKLADKILGF